MSEVVHSTVHWQVYEYSPVLEDWMFALSPTESEQQARDDLAEMRRIYPEARFRLVKIENTVTVVEGLVE